MNKINIFWKQQVSCVWFRMIKMAIFAFSLGPIFVIQHWDPPSVHSHECISSQNIHYNSPSVAPHCSPNIRHHSPAL